MIDAYRFWMEETTPQSDMIVMLYDHALLLLREAENALTRKKYDAVNASLLKVQRIVEELDLGLDQEKGGEVAANLHRLYQYLLRRLIDANIQKQHEPVQEVERTVASLRDAWQNVIHQVVM